jgi:hypothetical protein
MAMYKQVYGSHVPIRYRMEKAILGKVIPLCTLKSSLYRRLARIFVCLVCQLQRLDLKF